MAAKPDIVQERVVLRTITVDDLSAVTDVHLDSFPKSALSRLGPSTVECYYRWQFEGPHEKVWAVGAFLGETCVGYSFSGAFNGSTSGFIKRYRRHLAGRVLRRPWLLFDQLFLERFRSGLALLFGKKKGTSSSSETKKKPRSFGILSIAVAGKYQKLGIGKILMLDAEREAVESHFGRMHLTVSPDNAKAIRFYENLGWVRHAENGSWRGLMVKSLSQEAGDDESSTGR